MKTLLRTLTLALLLAAGLQATAQAWATPVAFGSNSQPSSFALLPADVLQPNYPNPVSGQTTIPFALTQAGPVQLRVFDITGRLVATLLDDVRAAGTYRVSFQTQHLQPGLYLYQLKTPVGAVMRRMTLK